MGREGDVREYAWWTRRRLRCMSRVRASWALFCVRRGESGVQVGSRMKASTHLLAQIGLVLHLPELHLGVANLHLCARELPSVRNTVENSGRPERIWLRLQHQHRRCGRIERALLICARLEQAALVVSTRLPLGCKETAAIPLPGPGPRLPGRCGCRVLSARKAVSCAERRGCCGEEPSLRRCFSSCCPVRQGSELHAKQVSKNHFDGRYRVDL